MSTINEQPSEEKVEELKPQASSTNKGNGKEIAADENLNILADSFDENDNQFAQFDFVNSAIGEQDEISLLVQQALAVRFAEEQTDTPRGEVIDAKGAVIGSPPQAYRVKIEGTEHFGSDSLEDVAILEYELDRRRMVWWKQRRWLLYSFAILTPLLFIIGLVVLLIGSKIAALFLWLSLVALLITLGWGTYIWLTRPQIASFGRVYRRYVGVPLDKNGLVWNDPTVAPPDFPSLRDNFFTLYRDSDDLGTKVQVNDDEETERKKNTLNELRHLIAPIKGMPDAATPTPYVSRDVTDAFDYVWMQALLPQAVEAIAGQVVIMPPQPGQTQALERLTREVEDYAGLDDFAPNMLGAFPNEATIHKQIANKVAQNLQAVGAEMGNWQERADRERAFNMGLLAHYRDAESAVRQGYNRVEQALEVEIRPAIQRLEHENTFFRAQINRYYAERTEEVEARRDSELANLEQTRQELEANQAERQDEQRLLQAELKGLNEQRIRLDNSTNSRFEGLKAQLRELTGRSYNLPVSPRFRSDYEVAPAAGDSEEILRLLAQLRADTRLATSAVNNSINRYARLRFDSLDELGRLEQSLSAGTKWQATAHLGNLINFRYSGQLLGLAGEVGDSVGVFLDSVNEFERLNSLWCSLESAIRTLGLSSYTNQLAEAQRYLETFQIALGSLHSSLAMAPHSPEMARPSTFQNLYDLAAGLQRELDELGGLAGAIARTQERLSELEVELAQSTDNINLNVTETAREKQESAERLEDIARKQSSILAKLEEIKNTRVQKIRGHMVSLKQNYDNEVTQLATGEASLNELSEISEKILQKHLRQSQSLLENANKLQQGLENTISAITEQFERAALTDRSLRATCELYVPIWYFQFVERPVWAKRTHAFAHCYSKFKPTEPNLAAEQKNSVWKFIFSNQPSVYYKVEENRALSQLVKADQLDYPAGTVAVPFDLL